MTRWMSTSIPLLLSICSVSHCQRTFLDDYIPLYRAARKLGREIVGKTTVPGSRPFEIAKRNGQLQEQISPNVEFPCDLTDTRSSKPPTSVHKLRPGDIDVIAAMGDSLSAGVGATATVVTQLTNENRGVAWSGGGQGTWREFMTLPNIVKVFNPNLVGYALSDSFTNERESQLNVAENGAMSRDMPYMAEILVKRMRSDPRVDVQKHWKLITIMIGGNDFCSEMCYQSSTKSIIEQHRANLLATFRILRDNLPRTIVSLVNGPDLSVLYNTGVKAPICMIVRSVFCSCLFGLRWRHLRSEYSNIMREWQDMENEFALMPEFQRDDFTIVVQPYTRNVSIPTLPSGATDFTFLSADCFHLSQKSYARAANAVWNNMLEPPGNKTQQWETLFQRILCPTKEKPYLATIGNS